MVSQSSAAGAGLLARPSLTFKRRLNARPEKVYAAWTNPQELMQWFGPPAVVAGTVQADIDLRVGGGYRIGFDMIDGEHNEVGGVYREVVPDARLVFTWAWRSTPERESLVTVAITADGGGTLLTLHHQQFADEAARDVHEAGWTGTLDKLEKYLA
jgi:uncharacterized protein YndB with AHSA1/START domain